MKHRCRRTAVLASAVSATLLAVAAIAPDARAAETTVVGRRALGIDVSDWQEQNAQGHINWATVAAPVSAGGAGKNFAFIRSSRGGTTGTYDEHAGTGTLSNRYDDYEWVYNITNATANGLYAGPYHFARADILTNTGADEADHMIQQAGNWMRPGYMLPVFDFEAGASQRDSASLSAFSVEFANRIQQVKGIKPVVYINQSYAQGGANGEIDATIPAAMPNNWVARWPNQIYYEAVEHQNGNPIPSPVTANVYGLWNASFPIVPQPEPWKFWQYSSRGRVPGIGNGVVDVDLDVAHGDMEYVKDFLVPAMWMTDTSGEWSTLSQWNSDNPGYIAGNDATGPAPRLPNNIDTVILDRGAANPTITLSSGSQSVRKLIVREQLNLTGGSLDVGYVPRTATGGNVGGGPISAQFSNNVTLSGAASMSVHTLQVDANSAFNLNGGSLTFDTINLAPNASNPGRIFVGGDVSITPLSGKTATIASPGLVGEFGTLNLQGGTRTLTVADGAAETDLLVKVAITNGGLVKAGLGTMRLATAPSGLSGITVSGGTLVAGTTSLPAITSNARFVLDLPASGTYAGTISGNGTFVKSNVGQLDLTASSPFSGALTVNESTARLTGANGRLASAGGYNVFGGTLSVDNAGSNNNDRLSGGGIVLNGGTLNFVANSTNEATGDILATGGANTVALSGTGNAAITFGSLNRSAGATINFSGVGGAVQAKLTSGFLPEAFVNQATFANGVDYAVVNADGSVRAMTVGGGPNDYASVLTPGRHVRLSSDVTVSASQSIKTLHLAAAPSNMTLAAGTTLTLTHGGIIKSAAGGTSSVSGFAGSSIVAPAEVEFVFNVAADALQITAPISGGSGLTKSGGGTLVLGGANTCSGPTSVNAGVLVAGPGSVNEDTLIVSPGATFRTAGAFDTGRSVVVAGGGSGTLDTQAFNSTFRGVISGAGGLTKTGAGTLVLNGATNTYAGPTTIAAGTLAAGHANLGNEGDRNELVMSGGVLRTLGAIDMSRAISGSAYIDTNGYDSVFRGDLTGGGLSKQGAGTLTLTGSVTNSGVTSITGGTLIASQLGTNTLDISNGARWRVSADTIRAGGVSLLTPAGGVIDTDGYALTINGALGSVVGVAAFTKAGHGQLTLTAANSLGPVAINTGTLRLAGASGTIASASVTSFAIQGGAVLKLDNASAAGGNNNNRLSNTAPVTLNGGTVWLYGGPTTETAGSLTLAGGYNHIIVNGSTTSTLALGTLTRQQGATLNVLGPTSSLKTSSTGGVAAGAFINQGVFTGTNYAVYDAAGYVRAMTTGAGDSDYATAVTTDRHSRLTAATTNIPTTSVYTLSMAHSTTVTTHTLAAGATLTLSKGGLLSSGTGGVTISGGTAITAPAGVEVVVHTPDSGDLLTIATPITGGSGLTKSGLGRLSLNNTGNSYAGPTIVAGGTLRLSTNNVIPDASALTIGVDAQFDLATRSETVNGLTMYEDAQVVSFNSSNVASPGTLTMNGASPTISYIGAGRGAVIGGGTLGLGTSLGTASINVADGNDDADLIIRSNVTDGTGNHSINKLGAGTLVLAGTANSFTGGVAVTAGRLDVDGALTSSVGVVDIPAGGTLGGGGTINKQMTLTGGTIEFRSGATVTNSLSVSGAGGTWKGQGTVSPGVSVTGGTFMIGAGANLTATNGVNVTGGTLAAMHANSTITGSVIYGSATAGTWGGNITGAGKTLTVNNAASLTLASPNAYTGGTNIADGQLIVTGNNQLGSGAVTTGMVVAVPSTSSHGGALRLSGNVSYSNVLNIGGGGLSGSTGTAPGSVGALDNLSGVNTWSGPITLNGTQNNGAEPLLNQIGATAGTLVLSGIIQGGSGQSWAKTGNGDVVLAGGPANTYNHLTRLFGGRLIVEKDGGLGAAGSNSAAAGNTFQLIGSASTLAFRAPASSPSGYDYSTFEVINTEGTGAPGFGQVDNLGGDNTFAGQIAFGGPIIGGGDIAGSIGVAAGSLHIEGGLMARSSPGTARSIVKLGPGTLILSGDSSAAPPNPAVTPLVNSTVQIGAGTVELRSPSPMVTNVPGVRTWEVEDGATLRLASGLLEAGTIGVADRGLVVLTPGTGKVVRTNSLNMAPLARVDLADGDMIVDYNPGFSPIGSLSGATYTGITGKIQSARNGGGWDQPGITTTQANAATGLTSLGVAEASDVLGLGPAQSGTWNGQSVDASSVLVMYTYAGDANLDGFISGDDYANIDFAIAVPSASGWANGDFNYDGIISGDDYSTIDFNIVAQGAPLSSGGAVETSGVVAVPEPTTMSVIALAFAGACVKRRRK